MDNIKVIIIIGLPSCGKTTYLNKNFNGDDYIIHDDFVSKFNDGQLELDMQYSKKTNKKICIADSRLCIFSGFLKYMETVEKYISRDQIQLILFTNDPDKCLLNSKHKVGDINKLDILIKAYSKVYDITNYINWNHKIVRV